MSEIDAAELARLREIAEKGWLPIPSKAVLALIDALEKARAINECHCVNVEATTSERDLAESALAAALPFLAPQPSQSDEEAWTDLCEKDDRTSPESYPDFELISHAEFLNYLSAVRAEATLAGAASEREAALADTRKVALAGIHHEEFVRGIEFAQTAIAAAIQARKP